VRSSKEVVFWLVTGGLLSLISFRCVGSTSFSSGFILVFLSGVNEPVLCVALPLDGPFLLLAGLICLGAAGDELEVSLLASSLAKDCLSLLLAEGWVSTLPKCLVKAKETGCLPAGTS